MTLPKTWKLFRALRHVNRMTQVKMRPIKTCENTHVSHICKINI
jgi:hypothetical protein